MNLLSFSSLSAALIFLGLGLFVYFKNRRNSISKVFLGYFVSLAIWSFGIFGLVYTNEPKIALVSVRILNIGLVFIPYFFFRFVTSLLNLKQNTKIALFFSLLSLVLSFTTLFTKGVNRLLFGFVASPGPAFPIFLLGFVYLAGYGHYLLFKFYKTLSRLKQMQVNYVLVGSLILLIGGLSVVPSIFGFVIFGGFPLWNFTNIVYGLILSYTIIRYHLMDINIVFKKTVVYTLLTTFIVGIYVAIILIFETIFQKLAGYTSLLVRILAGFLIAISFQPLRNKIEFFIDRVFFRTKYDYQKTLLAFSQSLGSILDLRTLLDLIIKVTVSTLKINKASVMLLNKDTNTYFITSHIGLPYNCRSWRFNMESKLISWLTTEKKIAVRFDFHKRPLSLLHFRIMAEMRLLRSAISIPLLYKQELVGVLNIGEKLSGESYTTEDLELLDTLGSESAIAISNANLYNTLEKTYLQTIQALTQAIEAKDKYTRGHSERVTKVAIDIAKELNIGREDIETLQYACILHDIGKIAIEEDILNKPGKLTEAEYEHIKTHSIKGEEIISPITFLEKIKPIIRHHHERYDGKGYPDGLKGTDTPILARILSIADVFDALMSERPYRVFKMTEGEALVEIQRCSGTQFDPDIVQALIKICKSKGQPTV